MGAMNDKGIVKFVVQIIVYFLKLFLDAFEIINLLVLKYFKFKILMTTQRQ